MKFSNRSIELLLDLIEIKLSTITVYDKEDTSQVRALKSCRNQLLKELAANQEQKSLKKTKCS